MNVLLIVKIRQHFRQRIHCQNTINIKHYEKIYEKSHLMRWKKKIKEKFVFCFVTKIRINRYYFARDDEAPVESLPFSCFTLAKSAMNALKSGSLL